MLTEFRLKNFGRKEWRKLVYSKWSDPLVWFPIRSLILGVLQFPTGRSQNAFGRFEISRVVFRDHISGSTNLAVTGSWTGSIHLFLFTSIVHVSMCCCAADFKGQNRCVSTESKQVWVGQIILTRRVLLILCDCHDCVSRPALEPRIDKTN